MIPPATKSNHTFEGTFLAKISIEKAFASTPETLQASYEFHAAIGTPIKFTKSLPEKAIANEKVPIPIISFNTFKLNNLINT